ncbi:MAG: 4'-phosphopantetheinyl transferase superfamily protein [Acidobacteria bacterium]|nr:4'-phosphopantetheinyl transferase superfamily protein [Acidobacteriota bacterium]
MTFEDAPVHVWAVELERAGPFEHLLSPEETERAARFHFECDRIRYARAHGALRVTLARYTGSDPRALRFRREARGKPVLEDRELHFSLSHSLGVALIAVSRLHEVGVDVERIREPALLDRLGARCLAPSELSDWRALPRHARAESFLRVWTRKEALLKGLGRGLGDPLSCIELRELESGISASGSAPAWFICDLDSVHGYISALAIEGGKQFLSLRV